MARGTVIATILIVAGLVYAALLAFFYVSQRAILFQAPTGYAPPASVGLDEVREEPITTADGERIMVWRHHPPGADERTVLFFHGNGDKLPSLAEHIRFWDRTGWGVAVPTYRGYPGSTGRPSEEALVSDGIAVFDSLVADGIPPEAIVIAGNSLGSAVAVAVAAERSSRAVVLYGALSSVADVAAWHYPFLPVRAFIRDPFDSRARIAQVEAPVYFVHGEEDRVVPLRFGERLLNAITGPAVMTVIPGAGHVLPPEAGWQAFESLLSREWAERPRAATEAAR